MHVLQFLKSIQMYNLFFFIVHKFVNFFFLRVFLLIYCSVRKFKGLNKIMRTKLSHTMLRL